MVQIKYLKRQNAMIKKNRSEFIATMEDGYKIAK